MIVLWHLINIIELLKLTQGKGHKVKGQGQICNYVKTTINYRKLPENTIMTLTYIINGTLKLT